MPDAATLRLPDRIPRIQPLVRGTRVAFVQFDEALLRYVNIDI